MNWPFFIIHVCKCSENSLPSSLLSSFALLHLPLQRSLHVKSAWPGSTHLSTLRQATPSFGLTQDFTSRVWEADEAAGRRDGSGGEQADRQLRNCDAASPSQVPGKAAPLPTGRKLSMPCHEHLACLRTVTSEAGATISKHNSCKLAR